METAVDIHAQDIGQSREILLLSTLLPQLGGLQVLQVNYGLLIGRQAFPAWFQRVDTLLVILAVGPDAGTGEQQAQQPCPPVSGQPVKQVKRHLLDGLDVVDILHLAHIYRQHLEGELITESSIAIHHIGDGLDNPHTRVKTLDDEVAVNLDAVVTQVGRVGQRTLGNLNHGAQRVGLLIGEKSAGILVLGDFQM